MATEEIRVYAVINADFTVGQVNEADWIDLVNAAKTQPLSAAIVQVAQNRNDGAQTYITAKKRSLNAAHLLLNTLIGFELDRDDVDSILVVLDEQAVIHGVTGWNGAKFDGVLTAELRAAAASLGYGPVAQNNLSTTLINAQGYTTEVDGVTYGTFSRLGAIAQGQAYLAANAAIWYA